MIQVLGNYMPYENSGVVHLEKKQLRRIARSLSFTTICE